MSYLLINFWFTRLEANKAAMLALLMNRVGDWTFSMGIYIIALSLGTLDFASLFSVTYAIDQNLITLICILLFIGAMAKSAQLGLNTWLPQAMEGGILLLFLLIFQEYLLTEFFNSMIFLNSIPISKKSIKISKHIEDAIIGDLLGDGHINMGNIKKWPGMNGRLEFTFSKDNLPYLRHLKFFIYADICTKTEPTPYPNPKTGKLITQYWFSTRRLPYFTNLHKKWYKEIEGKYVKILSSDIKESFKPIGLAHLIMGDGYWDGNTVRICTDNFSFEEVHLLADIITQNFNIIAKVIKRTSDNGNICWRIRIRKSSMEKLTNFILPYMIPEMLYKLNI